MVHRAPGPLQRALSPYLLVMPAGLWLLMLFVVPTISMASLSLMAGNLVDGWHTTGDWPQTYLHAVSSYREQILRSLWYALLATLIQVAMAFPIAYYIAFRAKRHYRSSYLILLLLPFFVSFVLRTAAWKQILTDEGMLLSWLRDWGMVSGQFHILGTPAAVVLGLTYSYLPFMVLPIYVALERIDPAVMEAARDLYASPVAVFRRVILPLSMPGVFAGVLMTFVPAASDYVESEMLGGPDTTMVGQVIQSQYLYSQNYPTASALSFIVMAALLVGIFLYARALGTEDVLEVAAR